MPFPLSVGSPLVLADITTLYAAIAERAAAAGKLLDTGKVSAPPRRAL